MRRGSSVDDAGKLLDALVAIDHVRYCTILDSMGNLSLARRRSPASSAIPPPLERRLEVQLFLGLKMAEEYQRHNGLLDFTWTKWEKMSALACLFDRGGVVVALDEGATLGTLRLIRRAIDSWSRKRVGMLR